MYLSQEYDIIDIEISSSSSNDFEIQFNAPSLNEETVSLNTTPTFASSNTSLSSISSTARTTATSLSSISSTARTTATSLSSISSTARTTATSSSSISSTARTAATSSSSISSTATARTTTSSSSSATKRYSSKFKKEWLFNSMFSTFLRECKTDSTKASCTLCNAQFSIANNGIGDVNRHIQTKKHQECVKSFESNRCKMCYYCFFLV